MTGFNAWLDAVDSAVWGVPMMVLILGIGLLLSFRMGFLQFRKLPKALVYMMKNEKEGHGEVSSFAALTTALAATVGTGNIVGVATAVVIGGPGALFWMIIAACLGMATKYAEGLLAVKYRVLDENGKALGGPFYYIEKGLGQKWKWLAKLFAFFGFLAGVMGIGTITQASSITAAFNTLFDAEGKHIAFSIGEMNYTWATTISAVVVAGCAALVIIGGIKRISDFASRVVPAMMVLYVGFAIIILIAHAGAIPTSLVRIVTCAFGADAVAGGAVGAMMVAMQKGIARGIFSNESGLGSAPIAAAAAQTKEPVRQGLVSMTGTFLDTIVICTMTGLCIMTTGAYDAALAEGLEGVQLTIYAFGHMFWGQTVGAVILSICLAIFAFTTILGWDYYGEKCLQYFSNNNMGAVKVYRVVYIIAVLVGPFLTLSAVWTIADIFNGLMAFPNLVGLFGLSGVVVAETRSYFKRLANGEIDEGL